MSDRRQWRAVMAIVATVVVLVILWQARLALLPFAVGAVLAVLVTPLVDLLASRIRFRRLSEETAVGISIAIVYLAGLGLVALAFVLLAPPAVENIDELVDRREEIYADITERVTDWVVFYEENAPEALQRRVNEAVSAIGDGLGDLVSGSLQRTLSVLASSFSVAAGFVIIPFWLVYAIKDRRRGTEAFYELFPASWRTDVEHIARHSGDLLKRYLRVQLLLAVIVFGLSWAGLAIIGVPYALPLALVLGFTELIVIIGPIIGGVIAVLVTLAVDPGWTALWVLLLVVGIQQIENILLVPRLQGAAINMHPALIIVLLAVVGQVFGLMGMIVALPVAAVLRDAYLHIYRRLGEAADQGATPS